MLNARLCTPVSVTNTDPSVSTPSTSKINVVISLSLVKKDSIVKMSLGYRPSLTATYRQLANKLLIISPLVHPGALYLLQVAFVSLLACAGKVGQAKYPFQKLGKAYAVYF